MFYRRSPLHIAVRNESIDIIKLLMKNKNFDPNVKDEILFAFNQVPNLVFEWLLFDAFETPHLAMQLQLKSRNCSTLTTKRKEGCALFAD